ncbi:prolyl-tRNA editing enzyme YbaK/EbsC (Cys-tRNA(Pro) deacylase) [Cytobacillus purgationiresistens]|uniref:Prolyl-tRNA editing enzyme YbaK/EbsC (Cys-tRNA(Pro) deacylase) n=2 Tax=Cytobacillus purgationiresistens TaxID=863449 RepID=A0ABU0AEW5_9BACI|nr:prolyl-tRNA editing enzyme YbaK/EbsC (Cys-tRNA(Pro) deacylase) [Cytobacillus purgationiresistens]
MATHQVVEEKTGYEVGSVLPFPYIIDQQLVEYDFIYGGIGEKYAALKIEAKAILELTNVVASFE